MSHCVAPCGDFSGEVGRVPESGNCGEIRANFGKCCRNTKIGSLKDFRGSKIKQEKERRVAYAPTSPLTADGNADRKGILVALLFTFTGWVADIGTAKTDRLQYA